MLVFLNGKKIVIQTYFLILRSGSILSVIVLSTSSIRKSLGEFSEEKEGWIKMFASNSKTKSLFILFTNMAMEHGVAGGA